MNTTTISYEHALYPDDGVDEGDDGQEGSNVEQGRQGDDKAALLTFDALKYASGNCQRLPCFLLLMPLISGDILHSSTRDTYDKMIETCTANYKM